MKICILLRVYNRIADLEANISIINQRWKNYDYDILVVSNGREHGFTPPEQIRNQVFRIVDLPNNSGHLSGNSQLLLAGCQNIDFDAYGYILILEADTWLCDDRIIKTYVERLEASDAVWASARWYDKFYSLATDFALIKSSFLKNHTDIFNFTEFPECFVCNYLVANELKYIYIRENMPVGLPSYIRKYPYAPKRRFFLFPKSGMLTHHIELLKRGMDEKKAFFNLLSGSKFFETPIRYSAFEKIKIRSAFLFQSIFIRRSWYSQRRYWKPE